MPWNTVPDSRPPPRESGKPLARRRPKGRRARLVAVGAAATVATVVQFPLAAQPSQPPEPAKTLSAPAANPASNSEGDTLQSGSPLKGSQSGSDSLQPDPVPPRMLFLGAAAADARTLAAGRGYAGIGYAGADIFAQLADFGESRPLIVHVAYGVTDDFTLAVGSGIWNYDSGGYFEGGTETTFFHYVAPKLRVLKSGGASASLGGRLIVPSGEDAEGYFYGVTMAFSATLERLAGHLSLGVNGSDDAGFGPDDDFAVTIGADYSVPLEDRTEYEFKPFAELRILGNEYEDLEILIAGVRLVSGGALAAELGFAKWFEEDTETRPVVSLAYRF